MDAACNLSQKCYMWGMNTLFLHGNVRGDIWAESWLLGGLLRSFSSAQFTTQLSRDQKCVHMAFLLGNPSFNFLKYDCYEMAKQNTELLGFKLIEQTP